MKTQLIFDYECSKAFQYYYAMLGKLKLNGTISDEEMVSFFGFDHIDTKIEYVIENKLPYIDWKYGISNMLIAMTLFDDIVLSPCNDDSFLGFEGTRIKKNELINDMGISYKNKPKTISKTILKDTIKVFKSYRREIINAVNNDDSFMRLGFVHENCNEFETYLENKYYNVALKNREKRPVKDFLHRINPLSGIIDELKSIDDIANYRNVWDAEIYRYDLYMDKVFLHIYDVLSSKNGYSLSNKFNKINNNTNLNRKNLIRSNDEINWCIAQLKFSKNMMMIPQPESFEDVVKLRRNEDLKAFREVYAQWVTYLQNGDIESFHKIWGDVIKAKEALRKIDSYKKVDGNILTRSLFTLVGEIPLISEIISGYGYVSSIAVDEIERKNRWCNLPALSDTSDYFTKKS